MDNRSWYVGKSLEELDDAKLGLGTLKADLITARIALHRRNVMGRIAEHTNLFEGLERLIDETDGAIAVVQDVIDSGHTSDSAAEQADAWGLESAMRERQI